MHKTTFVLMAAILTIPACGAKPVDNPEEQQRKQNAKVSSAKADLPPTQSKKSDPRVLAQSGLDIGSKFQAFDIINCESGDRYCQVCKFGPNPKIMAVGTIDDPAFHEDIQNIDAIVQKYGEDRLKAFAVITNIEAGKSITPIANQEELQAKANDLRKKLNVSLPIVIPAAQNGAVNPEFDDYYNITQSRTVMFANKRNEVVYSAIAPADFAKLNQAIQAVLADSPAPTGEKSGDHVG